MFRGEIRHNNEKNPAHFAGVFTSIVIAMNDGLFAIAVLVFFLDYGLALARLTLLNNGSVPIPIAIMRFADAYSGSYGTGTNAHVIRNCGRRNDGYKSDS
jgi:hypothetical protein